MAEDYAENLFQAVDTIVTERIQNLPYDRTIRAKVINNSSAFYGLYYVTTDNYNYFPAYSEDTTYNLNDEVYVRIPAGDYRKQKVIIGKYIPEVTLNSTPTGNNLFYIARPGTPNNFIIYDMQDDKLGYLVSNTVRLDSYQLLLYKEQEVSSSYSPDQDNPITYTIQTVLVHYTMEDGILYADETFNLSNCFYGVDNGTTAELVYSKELDGQYSINELTASNGQFNISFIPTHQIVHPYTIIRAYITLSSGAIIRSNPLIFGANAQLSKKYRNFSLEVTNDQFFYYNACGKFIGNSNNLTTNITIIYNNLLESEPSFQPATINISGLSILSRGTSSTTYSGNTATITLTINSNTVLSTSFYIEHVKFIIIKDGVEYTLFKDFYFGYKQIDSNVNIKPLKLYLNDNDILYYNKLLVGNDGNLINISADSVNLGGKALTTSGTWAGTSENAVNAIVATKLSNTDKIGDIDKPVYFTASGIPEAITSIDETLLGFNSSDYGFSTTGQNTKLWRWLKDIQSNINALAAKHSDVTASWHANL